MTAPSDEPPPAVDPGAAPPARPGFPAVPPPHAHAPRRRRNPAVHIAWPLATIGVLSALAGNPLGPPPTTGLVSNVSPTSYVAPDGRTFAQLVAAHVLPDPTQTPGMLNTNVTQGAIQSTICVHGWTAKVRPPTSYTDPIKTKDLPPGAKPSDYELDHLDSIEDGGDPSNPQNLWTQAYNDKYGARVKDVLETKVSRMVCAGQLTLDQARAALAPNWLLGFEKYVGPLPGGSAPGDNDND